ncbi:hypothetical protein ACFWHV_24400 [Streptomyces collinus]|uniref:hypothetical protein n=1 Tax=Streptomyces collinus TaxID=42684 RepID=UPI00365D5BFC
MPLPSRRAGRPVHERRGGQVGSRHCLGRRIDDPDDLVGLIRGPRVGGRPFPPDGLPVIDRVPGHANAFAATGHGMLGVTWARSLVPGPRFAEYVAPGRRSEALVPFGFVRLRR